MKKSDLESICNLHQKIVEGPVRVTLDKLNVCRYILAAVNPQWNMPMLSKLDYDTLSPTVTNHIIKKDYKYKLAY